MHQLCLAPNSNLNLIKPLDLNKLQGLQWTEEHVKWYLEDAVSQLQVLENIDSWFLLQIKCKKKEKQ